MLEEENHLTLCKRPLCGSIERIRTLKDERGGRVKPSGERRTICNPAGVELVDNGGGNFLGGSVGERAWGGQQASKIDRN